MSAAGKPAATPRSSSAALEEVFNPQAIPDLLQAERGFYLCLSRKNRRCRDGASEMGMTRWIEQAGDTVMEQARRAYSNGARKMGTE